MSLNKTPHRQSGLDDSIKRVLRDYTEALLLAVIVAILLRVFVVTAYKVPTNTMAPNLVVGDFVFAIKWPFGIRNPFTGEKWLDGQSPQRGDVVVFSCPQSQRVKCVRRVVAIAGDRVQLLRQNLVLNNKKATYKSVSESEYSEFSTPGQSAVVSETIGSLERKIVITHSRGIEDFGPIVVPPGSLFVLADARGPSEDSRVWGPIPQESIEAQVVLIWMSLDWSEAWASGSWPKLRRQRIFKSL